MSFAALAVAVVIGAGATVGANSIKSKGLSKSAQIKTRAYDQLQPLDADELNAIAGRTDLARYANSIKAQQDVDPTFAAMRQVGAKNVLASLNADQRPGAADKAVSEIGAGLAADKGSNDEIIASLLGKVKEDLAAGATLPPEFQAELVRSGLENAGNRGVEISGRGAAGTDIRRLLGSEGLALKQAREANARTNLSAADNLRQGRQDALTRFAELTNNLVGAKFTRGAAGSQFAQSLMPSIGLSGADAAGIAIQNRDLANQKILAKAGVASDTAVQKAALGASSVGAVGSAATSLLGTPQAGSWIGGLFTSSQRPAAKTP